MYKTEVDQTDPYVAYFYPCFTLVKSITSLYNDKKYQDCCSCNNIY